MGLGRYDPALSGHGGQLQQVQLPVSPVQLALGLGTELCRRGKSIRSRFLYLLVHAEDYGVINACLLSTFDQEAPSLTLHTCAVLGFVQFRGHNRSD